MLLFNTETGRGTIFTHAYFAHLSEYFLGTPIADALNFRLVRIIPATDLPIKSFYPVKGLAGISDS